MAINPAAPPPRCWSTKARCSYELKLNEKLTIEANGGGSSVDVEITHLVGLAAAMGFGEE